MRMLVELARANVNALDKDTGDSALANRLVGPTHVAYIVRTSVALDYAARWLVET